MFLVNHLKVQVYNCLLFNIMLSPYIRHETLLVCLYCFTKWKKRLFYPAFFLFSAKLPSSGVNYVKLWVSDGSEGPGYALTLVASDMSKLMVRNLVHPFQFSHFVGFFLFVSSLLFFFIKEEVGLLL